VSFSLLLRLSLSRACPAGHCATPCAGQPPGPLGNGISLSRQSFLVRSTQRIFRFFSRERVSVRSEPGPSSMCHSQSAAYSGPGVGQRQAHTASVRIQRAEGVAAASCGEGGRGGGSTHGPPEDGGTAAATQSGTVLRSAGLLERPWSCRGASLAHLWVSGVDRLEELPAEKLALPLRQRAWRRGWEIWGDLGNSASPPAEAAWQW